jgi:predicted nuclease of predicted toxin-antitoxin system
MKIKLDENFDVRLVELLTARGHDVDTVRGEGLSGADDDEIYKACQIARRVILTLDMDFSNPLRFPPEPTAGILVVRVPRPILPLIRGTLESVAPLFEAESLEGKLWIVEPGRLRVYEPDDTDS